MCSGGSWGPLASKGRWEHSRRATGELGRAWLAAFLEIPEVREKPPLELLSNRLQLQSCRTEKLVDFCVAGGVCHLFQISHWSDVGIVPCSDSGIWKVLSPLYFSPVHIWSLDLSGSLPSANWGLCLQLSPCHFTASKQCFPTSKIAFPNTASQPSATNVKHGTE